MANYIRKNAWNQQGTFNNSDLLWYAKAVGVMKSRQLDDPTSWWFYAAIHGQYLIDNDGSGQPPADFPNWTKIQELPNNSTSPLPVKSIREQYWDQCQHAGWYFIPWHRGYLYKIEEILRDIIQNLGGPNDWALPYWDYFGIGSEYLIPPAFISKTLPDNTLNPLYVNARYGINGNGIISIPLSRISKKCQQDSSFINQYGGGKTGFVHFGNGTGSLEQNPHNLVHGFIGGQISNDSWGLMSDPGLAALDPIFYLHHCNIDRMWASWNKDGKTNPTDSSWINGPTTTGDRKFFMPNSDGTPWLYTPAMVNDTQQLNYEYDNFSQLQMPVLAFKNFKRLQNLTNKNIDINKIETMNNKGNSELVGANSEQISLTSSGVRTSVKIATSNFKMVTSSLIDATEKKLPDEVFLLLEGIKGNEDANIYSVSVNQNYIGDISLFGIRKASIEHGHHAGAGLTIKLEISSIIDELHLNEELQDSLDVLIQPLGMTKGECTIERISIYRQENK
jgi:tyrosinase